MIIRPKAVGLAAPTLWLPPALVTPGMPPPVPSRAKYIKPQNDLTFATGGHTYEIPSGVFEVEIWLTGGGGGGAGGGESMGGGAGGAGGGAFCHGKFAVTPGERITIYVPGWTNRADNEINGVEGGQTSALYEPTAGAGFEMLANGGKGGTINGQPGGTASGGNIENTSGNGGNSGLGSSGGNGGAAGGFGGNNPDAGSHSGSTDQAGLPGKAYGGGGGGGGSAGPDRSGGQGAPGLMRLRENPGVV